MSIEKRRNTYAFAKGTTWGTDATPGALSGMYVQENDGFALMREEAPDKGAGFGLETESHQGNDIALTPTWKLIPYEDDQATLTFLAAMLGSDTVTGVSDPYTHTMAMTETSGIFFSLHWEEGTETKRIPSAKLTGLSFHQNDQGIFEMDLAATGNTSDASGNVSSTTWKSEDNPFLFRNATFRINDQSGAALGSGDEIAVSDIKVDINRPSTTTYVTGGTSILEPAEGPFPEVLVEVTIPQKSADSVTLYTAWAAETKQKGDIVITGSSADRQLDLIFPQLKIESVENAHDEVIPTVVKMRGQVADSNPTGMDDCETYAVWKTDVSTSPIA